jgi:hypothetical protein
MQAEAVRSGGVSGGVRIPLVAQVPQLHSTRHDDCRRVARHARSDLSTIPIPQPHAAAHSVVPHHRDAICHVSIHSHSRWSGSGPLHPPLSTSQKCRRHGQAVVIQLCNKLHNLPHQGFVGLDVDCGCLDPECLGLAVHCCSSWCIAGHCRPQHYSARLRSTPQHAQCCAMAQCIVHSAIQSLAVRCVTLHCIPVSYIALHRLPLQFIASSVSQYLAAHGSTSQHIAVHRGTSLYIAAHCGQS